MEYFYLMSDFKGLWMTIRLGTARSLAHGFIFVGPDGRKWFCLKGHQFSCRSQRRSPEAAEGHKRRINQILLEFGTTGVEFVVASWGFGVFSPRRMVMRGPVTFGSRALVAVSSAALVVALCACGGIGNKASQTAVPLPTAAPNSGEQDGANMPPAKAPVENLDPDYIDASKQAAQQGEIRVSVSSVRIGKVKLKGVRESGESKDDLLQIGLTIENLSKTKLVHLSSSFALFQGVFSP